MPSPVWRSFSVFFKSWNDHSVVYNYASGSTHLINPVTAKILLVLQDHPCSAIEISKKIAADIEIDPDKEIIHRVETVLATLDDLGLIEPLPQ